MSTTEDQDQNGYAYPFSDDADMATVGRHAIAAAVRGREAAQRSMAHYREAGRMLRVAKKRGGHGEFTPWLKANWPNGPEHGRLLMRIDREWDEIVAVRFPESINEAKRILAEIRQRDHEPEDDEEENVDHGEVGYDDEHDDDEHDDDVWGGDNTDTDDVVPTSTSVDIEEEEDTPAESIGERATAAYRNGCFAICEAVCQFREAGQLLRSADLPPVDILGLPPAHREQLMSIARRGDTVVGKAHGIPPMVLDILAEIVTSMDAADGTV